VGEESGQAYVDFANSCEPRKTIFRLSRGRSVTLTKILAAKETV